MIRWILVLALALTTGCATFNTVGWNDLPDGSRLKAVKLQADTIVGTDINYGIVMQCPKEGSEGKCVKVGEFGGASASFLKAIFNGAAAGAAIGAGLLLQDDSIYTEGGEGGSARQSQGQGQSQGQSQKQQQRGQRGHGHNND